MTHHFLIFSLLWFSLGAFFACLFHWREMQNSQPYEDFRYWVRYALFALTVLMGPLNIFTFARSLRG